MKHILASQLTHGDANMATFFTPCNYSDCACHLRTRINMTAGSQERLCMSELNSPERSSGPFVDPRKGQALPIPASVSTQKPQVCLLPAGYC